MSAVYRHWSYCLVALTSILVSTGCEEKVSDGRILVLNDSQDSDYNILEVSGGGAFKHLKPGQTILLPRNTSFISFTRRYRDYTRYYEAECPATLTKGIRIKLIDVHVNRIAGGCKTTTARKE